MTARPVEYEDMTYYPIARQMCAGCAHEFSLSGCRVFTNFVKTNTGLNSSCTQGSRDVIWQIGDAAHLQYITEKLTA